MRLMLRGGGYVKILMLILMTVMIVIKSFLLVIMGILGGIALFRVSLLTSRMTRRRIYLLRLVTNVPAKGCLSCGRWPYRVLRLMTDTLRLIQDPPGKLRGYPKALLRMVSSLACGSKELQGSGCLHLHAEKYMFIHGFRPLDERAGCPTRFSS